MFVNFKQVCGNMLMWQLVRVVQPVNGEFLFFRYNQRAAVFHQISHHFQIIPVHTSLRISCNNGLMESGLFSTVDTLIG